MQSHLRGLAAIVIVGALFTASFAYLAFEVSGAASGIDAGLFTATSAIAWLSGVVTLVAAALFAWTLPRRHPKVQMAAAVQELALTPEIRDYLETNTRLLRNPLPTVLFIFALAAALPGLLSVAMLVGGRLLNRFTPVMWAFFLGLGGLVSVGVIRDLELEKRDLNGGLYVRWTGPFSVRVFRNRVGASATVVVGGRSLRAVMAAPLQAIQEGTGTVEYLPVSGELLEVRGGSGEVIWSRLAGHQSEAV